MCDGSDDLIQRDYIQKIFSMQKQIEKMKNCQNCEYSKRIAGALHIGTSVCDRCENNSRWTLREVKDE